MTETGKRYGTSLYELAAEEGLTERILAELDVAVNAMQEPGYLRLLMTPSVPKKERCVLLDQAFAQAHPYLVNFLKILCEAGILPDTFVSSHYPQPYDYHSLYESDGFSYYHGGIRRN